MSDLAVAIDKAASSAENVKARISEVLGRLQRIKDVAAEQERSTWSTSSVRNEIDNTRSILSRLRARPPLPRIGRGSANGQSSPSSRGQLKNLCIATSDSGSSSTPHASACPSAAANTPPHAPDVLDSTSRPGEAAVFPLGSSARSHPRESDSASGSMTSASADAELSFVAESVVPLRYTRRSGGGGRLNDGRSASGSSPGVRDTLFDRLGGNDTIAASVDRMYSKALQDHRVRAYFEKNTRKMASIRLRMQQYLSGLTGGPTLYDNPDALMNVHYYLNVTDYHFDTILELFKEAFEEVGVDVKTVEDTMTQLAKVRRNVTTGCTVRMEMARRHLEGRRGKDDALLIRLGGVGGLSVIMDRLYDLIAIDNRLRPFFVGKNTRAIKKGQLAYITELLGGPKVYKGRCLEAVHKDLGIDDYYFDCFLMNMEKAMAGLGFPEETIDEVLVVLEPIRAPVLNKTRGLNVRFNAEDDASSSDDSATLLDRLGGRSTLEQLIDAMYAGCEEDPRVRFFFSHPKAKADDIKAKIVQLLAGLSGGRQEYDVSNLRAAHYDANICDYQFDATCENLQVACELMDVGPAETTELLKLMGRARADVTAGCTVRYDTARRRIESSSMGGCEETLFKRLGGDPVVDRFVEELFELVEKDVRVNRILAGSKLHVIKGSFRSYVAHLFGSPREYKGRSLDKVHIFVQDCSRALNVACAGEGGVPVNSDLVDECIFLLETARTYVVSAKFQKYSARQRVESCRPLTLYDRLGGEASLVRLVDSVYQRALACDRVRSFFEKNRARVQAIKKNMSLFLCGLTGGREGYERSRLRPLHYGMNITDYHFDAVLDIFQEVLSDELSLPESVVQEMMRMLQSVRADITTGYAVRMEIARRNLEQGRDQLFCRVGGMKGVKKLINLTCELFVSDPRVRYFFDRDQTLAERIKAGQLVYITEVLGGPKAYKGRDLAEVHATLGITDYHFDTYLLAMQRAMASMKLHSKLIDEVMITLEPVRSDVLSAAPANGPSTTSGALSRSPTSAAAAAKLTDDGRPLIERLGGDLGLESLVEVMYDRVLEDPRVKFHFQKPPARQRQIRMKIYQYLSGAFGGPTQYDAANLRPAHYNMNISDHHFDAVCEAFLAACKEAPNVDSPTIEEALAIIRRIRPDITTGYRVRMELARKNNEQHGTDQLFGQLGGVDGAKAFVSRLYDYVAADPRIYKFFEGAKFDVIKQSQAQYLMMVLGGPPTYTGRPLEEVHAVLTVTDYHFDCFMQLIQRSLKDCGLPQDAIDEVTVVIEQQVRAKVVNSAELAQSVYEGGPSRSASSASINRLK